VTTLDAVAARLFEGVMAPLVLGGSVRPGHAIGVRAALALGSGASTPTTDPELLARVQKARVRRARLLVPIDEIGPPTGADWVLAAALHDVLQAMNPRMDTALRRGAAARLATLASHTIASVGPPQNVHEAVSRHTWLARMLDVTRTDTSVSWWSGSRVFLGVDPPSRLQAWPGLRRVHVTSASRGLLELAPLAIERKLLVGVLAELLAHTPLTDLATCTRAEPSFAWGSATLALIATRTGRTIALRALARLPVTEVDAALGRATRGALAKDQNGARPALELLAERAIAEAQGHVGAVTGTPLAEEAIFARRIGAAAALRMLESPDPGWPEEARVPLRTALLRWA
jgi:hypothetical protein